jgi:hypothetical protein
MFGEELKDARKKAKLTQEEMVFFTTRLKNLKKMRRMLK